MIRFTLGRKTSDRKQTYVPHAGSVPQGKGKVKKDEGNQLVITEYGVLPPQTPIEKKRFLDTEKLLTYFRRERE